MAHPGGRPTKYDDTWVPKLEEAMCNGYTVEMFCYETRIAVSTFYEWVKKYSEFSKAFESGRKDAEGFHQFYIFRNLENKNLNVGVLKLFMQNCFGWTDNKNVQQNVEIGVEQKTKENVDTILKQY